MHRLYPRSVWKMVVLVSDDGAVGSDLVATSYALALALEREEPALVLFGQQASDSDGAVLWAAVADRLRRPLVSQVAELTVGDGTVRGKRQTEYGYDTIEAPLPAVIAVSDAINEPRYPSLKGIMGAKKKPQDVLTSLRSARTRARSATPDRGRPCWSSSTRRRGASRAGSRATGTPPRRSSTSWRSEAAVTTLVFLEHHEGRLHAGSLGVLTRAAQLGGDVAAVIAGSGVAVARRDRRPLRRRHGLRRRRPAARGAAAAAARRRRSPAWPLRRGSRTSCSRSRCSPPTSPRRLPPGSTPG